MKKFFFLPSMVLASVFIILLFSCSKDKSTLPQSTNEALSVDNSLARIGNWGSVTGIILPLRAQVSIQIFDDKLSIKEIYYTTGGQFQIDRIRPGIYTIVITYLRPRNYPPTGITPNETTQYLMTGIKVVAGRITDIGTIKLR